jgi:uncharacterized protein YecE (DUF72 family)
MRVRVGLCGFTMAMEDYALHFPVVEVQNTFYEPPRDEVMQKWRAVAGPALEYTMKVWQLVTHSASSPTYRRMKRALAPDAEPGFFRDSEAVAEGWARSLRCADVLNATALLFQCPASFAPDRENVSRMRRFFARITRPTARLLWEPRGERWVAERSLALSLCRELNLVHVVDPLVTEPDPAQPVYWRLHGPAGPRSSYTDAQLQRLAEMLEAVDDPTPRYVMFNNLPRVGDAKRFVKLVGARERTVRGN